MENIYQCVFNEVCHLKGTLAVAVSGGADSMCLLTILSAMKNVDFKLIALNVEHGIRGESSLKDTELVLEYTKKLGIECITKSINTLEYQATYKVSLESAGRILRYRFFDEVLESKKADYILLAHHLDDLTETIIMRIFRGTGLEGLKGIQNRDRFIRPLLKVSKAEIYDYVLRNNIPYREDESNADINYTRNFIRNELMPRVEERWKDYRKSLLKLSERAKENEEFLMTLAPKPKVIDNAVYLNIDELTKSHIVLQKFAIRQAVNIINGGVDFEENNLNDVLELIKLSNGARVDLANGIRATKEYDLIVFEQYNPIEFETILFKVGEFRVGNDNWSIKKYEGVGIRFDINKIPENAVIRLRDSGDTFTRFSGITSSLGDFYTDKKVPKRLRDRYPIIAVGNTVLVTPIEIARSVMVDDESVENVYTLVKL